MKNMAKMRATSIPYWCSLSTLMPAQHTAFQILYTTTEWLNTFIMKANVKFAALQKGAFVSPLYALTSFF